MFDFDECKKIAADFVAKINEEKRSYWERLGQPERYMKLSLSEWHQQSEFCFAFSYNSKKYLETQNSSHCVVGQGPLIIDRRIGKVVETGSDYPRENYLENYEKRGDPYKNVGNRLKIINETDDSQRIAAIKTIRIYSGLGLKDAKNIIDSFLDSNSINIETPSIADATNLMRELAELGYETEQL